MDLLRQKLRMDRSLLSRNPSMFYLKIGAMLVGAYILGRVTKK